jgi:hypothetical protein
MSSEQHQRPGADRTSHWFQCASGAVVNLRQGVTIKPDGAGEKNVMAYFVDGSKVLLGVGTDKANARLIAQHIVLTDCSTWEQAVELAGGDGDDSCTTWDKATDHRTLHPRSLTDFERAVLLNGDPTGAE